MTLMKNIHPSNNNKIIINLFKATYLSLQVMVDLLYLGSYNLTVMVIFLFLSPDRGQVTSLLNDPVNLSDDPNQLSDPSVRQVNHQLVFHFRIRIHPNRRTGRNFNFFLLFFPKKSFLYILRIFFSLQKYSDFVIKFYFLQIFHKFNNKTRCAMCISIYG